MQVAYAIACVVVHQRAHLLVARHGPVPVGEMLFAVGFISGVEEACHCRCSAFVQDLLRGYSVGGTTVRCSNSRNAVTWNLRKVVAHVVEKQRPLQWAVNNVLELARTE